MPQEGLLERSWRPPEPNKMLLMALGASWMPLGELLEPSRVPSDLSGEPLGPSRMRFESSWGPLGRLLKSLGDNLVNSSKPSVFSMEFIDFSGLGRCSGPLGEALGDPWSAPGALLGALWAHLELLKPSWRPPGPSWSALGALLDALGAL